MNNLMAEFRTPDEILIAAKRMKDAGFQQIEAFTPFPVEGMDDALGLKAPPLGWIGLIGGIVGGGGFFLIESYATVFSYPQNIGGRPPFSWPYYIVPAFPVLVISAALAIVVGFFILNGFPRLHHPVFGVEGFERATQDRFFLRVMSDDAARAESLLHELNPLAIRGVPS
jgi:Protein of unknown function (DUF3341)